MLDSMMSGFTREAWYFFCASFVVLLAMLVLVSLAITNKLPGFPRQRRAVSAKATAAEPASSSSDTKSNRKRNGGNGKRESGPEQAQSRRDPQTTTVAGKAKTAESQGHEQSSPKKDWTTPSKTQESPIHQDPVQAGPDAASGPAPVAPLPDLPLPIRNKEEATPHASDEDDAPQASPVEDEEEPQQGDDASRDEEPGSVFSVFDDAAEEENETSIFAKNLKNVHIDDLKQEAEELMGWFRNKKS